MRDKRKKIHWEKCKGICLLRSVLAHNINSLGIDRATFCFTPWIPYKELNWYPTSERRVTPLLLVAMLPVLQIAKFLCVPVGHSGYSPNYLNRVYDRKFQRLGQCTDLAIKLFKKKKGEREDTIFSFLLKLRFQVKFYHNTSEILVCRNQPLNSMLLRKHWILLWRNLNSISKILTNYQVVRI